MTGGDRCAARALALVGAPFRLHGREAATGLDCIGLAASALAFPPGRVPTGYRLRGSDLAQWEAWLSAEGLVRAETPAAGDLVIVQPGHAQLHAMIETGSGLVHAHAGLGRVVFQPTAADWTADWPEYWPLVARWRAPTE